MDDMALDEQIAHLRQLITQLRQLAVSDPETGAVDQAFINALDELAEAFQTLAEAFQEHRSNPPRGLGSA
jgi:hypothetical protein